MGLKEGFEEGFDGKSATSAYKGDVVDENSAISYQKDTFTGRKAPT